MLDSSLTEPLKKEKVKSYVDRTRLAAELCNSLTSFIYEMLLVIIINNRVAIGT